MPAENSPAQELRRSTIALRKTLEHGKAFDASHRASELIKRLDAFRKARTVGLYHAFSGELRLDSLVDGAREQGKILYLPKVSEGKTLRFVRWDRSTPLSANTYGIQEPQSDVEINPSHLDIVLVPLVAFDSFCNRLGYGQGFYDNTFAKQRPGMLLGVAYDFQCQLTLEPKASDVRLDGVITPSKIYWSL